jgi:hypothetical protein
MSQRQLEKFVVVVSMCLESIPHSEHHQHHQQHWAQENERFLLPFPLIIAAASGELGSPGLSPPPTPPSPPSPPAASPAPDAADTSSQRQGLQGLLQIQQCTGESSQGSTLFSVCSFGVMLMFAAGRHHTQK